MRWLCVLLVLQTLSNTRTASHDDYQNPQREYESPHQTEYESHPHREYEEEWNEMSPHHGEQHLEYEGEIQETTTEFINPWTLVQDSRVFEDDDEDLNEYRQEWEAPEFQTTTTQPTRATRTRRTFNWTRNVNWTTRLRTTRKWFTGVTYNSSHCLPHEDLQLQPYVERNDILQYVAVEKTHYYNQIIAYREKQIKEYEAKIDKLANQIASMETVDKSIKKDSFRVTSDTDIVRKLFTDMYVHKLSQEKGIYEKFIENYLEQIEVYNKLNQLEPKKDALLKEIKEYEKEIVRGKRKKKVNNETYIEMERHNNSYHAILNEREPLLQSLNSTNNAYGEMLDEVEQVKQKAYTFDDYENELFNIKHLQTKLELDLTYDRISLEDYEPRKAMLTRSKEILHNRMVAAQYLQDLHVAKYHSTLLKPLVKTNVTLDHYVYNLHNNFSLVALGDELRNLFNVKSLEYEYDVTPSDNCTDEYDGEATVPFTLEPGLNISEWEHTNANGTENSRKMVSNEGILRNEYVNRTQNSGNIGHNEHILRNYYTTGTDHRGIIDSDERPVRIREQDYNVLLAEKYMKELQDLDEYVDKVHNKINATHLKFTQLFDKLSYSMSKFKGLLI